MAEELRMLKPSITDPRDPDIRKLDQWEDDCRAIARACSYMNPQFQRTAFLLECGMDREEIMK